jgi:hypothetical protein
MLRRRCHTIVAVDAGCDPDSKFEDLANAVRKARIDFGVEIYFDQQRPPAPGCELTRLGLTNRPKKLGPSPYCTIGTFHYPGIRDTGTLIYMGTSRNRRFPPPRKSDSKFSYRFHS